MSTSLTSSDAHTLPYPVYIYLLMVFGNGMKNNHFLMSCWEDGSYLKILWDGGNIVKVTSITCQRYNPATSKSSFFSVCWEINLFLDMLVLTAINCPFRAKFYDHLKTEIIFLKTAVQSLFPPIFVPDSTRTGAIVCMVGRYPIKAQAEILDTRTWLCDHLLRF